MQKLYPVHAPRLQMPLPAARMVRAATAADPQGMQGPQAARWTAAWALVDAVVAAQAGWSRALGRVEVADLKPGGSHRRALFPAAAQPARKEAGAARMAQTGLQKRQAQQERQAQKAGPVVAR